MKTAGIMAILALAALFNATGISANTIFLHSGANDPTTEGWSTVGTFVNVSIGRLTPDPVGGLDSWFVNDTGTNSGELGGYIGYLSDVQYTQAQTNGWTLSVTLRMPNVSETDKASPAVLYRDGSTSYQMHFGSQSNGNPFVLLWDGVLSNGTFTGPRFVIDRFVIDRTEPTYHTFNLVFDPLAESANLFVDGVEQLSNYTGFSSDLVGVFFGAGGSYDTGQANFNHVAFSVNGAHEVDIDIKPGNKHNVINPRAKGGIWVAVLSDTDSESPFDPSSQVDIPSVEFGPGAKATRHKVKDINKDGLGDLLLRFKISATGIACGDTEATLTGETFDGQSFTETDSITTVGCKPKKCHKKKHHKKHHDDDCEDDKKHHGKQKEKKHHENDRDDDDDDDDDDRDDDHEKR